MNKYIVRKANVSDAKGIAKVHLETWQCAYSGQIPDSYLQSLSIEKRTDKWKEILSHPEENAYTLVCTGTNDVRGFCTVSHCRDNDMSSDVGELWAVYVDKNHMKKGIGSLLMETGLDYLVKQGYKRATLWVLTSNELTKRWYESKGWKREGKVKTVKFSGIDIEEIRYIFDLDARL